MKAFALLALFATFFFAGCKSMDSRFAPDYQGVNYSSPLDLSEKSPGMSVSLLALKDTRCPQNVICIQPGWVDLLLLVKNQADSVRVEIAFHNDPKRDKPKPFKLGSTSYTLTVHRVLPVPIDGKKLKIEDYTVAVSVAP
jgi:hypothetical protein